MISEDAIVNLRSWFDLGVEKRQSPSDARVLAHYFPVLQENGSFAGIDIPSPGSIILVRREKAVAGQFIALVQSRHFENPLHSMWSHIGIMGLGGQVWDIMPGKHVRQISFPEFLDRADYLAVRELDPRVAGLKLDRLFRVLHDQAGVEYPNFLDPKTVYHHYSSVIKGIRPETMDIEQMVCSQFVHRILTEVFECELFPQDRPLFVLPGHFARSTAFVDMDWNQCMYRVDQDFLDSIPKD